MLDYDILHQEAQIIFTFHISNVTICKTMWCICIIFIRTYLSGSHLNATQIQAFLVSHILLSGWWVWLQQAGKMGQEHVLSCSFQGCCFVAWLPAFQKHHGDKQRWTCDLILVAGHVGTLKSSLWNETDQWRARFDRDRNQNDLWSTKWETRDLSLEQAAGCSVYLH